VDKPLPNGLFTGAATVLLALGGVWWTAHAPAAAAADPQVRPDNRLVRTVGNEFTVQRRRVGRWRCEQAAGLRSVGQDNITQRC
jgi:hypothetical protein